MTTPRTSRPRVAPSARQVASSARRDSVRMSSSVPTAAQPMRSSSPTVTASKRAKRSVPARARAGIAATFTGVRPNCRGLSIFAARPSSRAASSAVLVSVRIRPTILNQAIGDEPWISTGTAKKLA